MSLKTISVNYNETEGTVLPNYGKKTNILGMDPQWDAPGYGFVAGLQQKDDDYLYEALENGWLVDDVFVSGDFSKTYSQQYTIRTTFRPIDGLRIQLEASKNVSQNINQYFFYDDADTVQAYNLEAPPIISGSYSMSFWSLGTSFVDDNGSFENKTFETLRNNRSTISTRLGEQNANSIFTGEYSDGYGETSQEVLLHSFISAYSDKSPSKVDIGDFTKLIPKPNWNITYDGLTRVRFFQKYFKQITINHRYRSTFSVSSYTRNPNFESNSGGPTARDINSNFIADKQLSSASIVEQFSPLINIDMTWNSSLLTRLEMRQDRNVSLSFANLSLIHI